MLGKAVNVLKTGDVVNAGKTTIILDAMKMENILKSDYKAKVLEIFIEKGQAVSADQNLIKIQQLNQNKRYISFKTSSTLSLKIIL